MHFIVHDRGTMARMIANPPAVPWSLISISHLADWPEHYANEVFLGRLNQQYHDVDFPAGDERETGEARVLFSEQMARDVIDFYQRVKEQGCRVMYVHCQAGMCRSPATAAVLQKLDTGDDSIWFKTKRPNMRVYRMLINEAFDQGLIR